MKRTIPIATFALAAFALFAWGSPTKTGDLIVNGSASISGSAIIAGSAYAHTSEEILSLVGSGLQRSGRSVSMMPCPLGQRPVSLGTGSGYACGSEFVNDAPSGDLTLSLDGETLVGYAGSACGSGEFAESIGSDGSLICDAPPASFIGSACSSGWVTAYESGSATCTTPSASDVGALSGIITSPDLVVATGTGTVGNYAGSSPTACTTGNLMSNAALSAAGAISLTCSSLASEGIASGTGTTNTIPEWTNTSGGLGDSPISVSGSTVSTNDIFNVNNNITSTGIFTTTSYVNIKGNGTGTTGSVLAGTTSSNGTVYLHAGASTADAGFSCGFTDNSAQTCHYGPVGYSNGTTQARSHEFDDGKGSGAAHTIALLDASTHGLFVGSGNTVAEDLASNGTPSGSCGSGSIDRDYASGGTVYLCVAGAWLASASWDSSVPSANTIVKSDGTGLVASTATDTGSLYTIPEALTQTGTTNINSTGTSATTIGNMSGNLTLTGNGTSMTGSGNTTIDPNGELILDGQFSTILKAGSGSSSIYLEGVLQTTNVGVSAPSISGGTCASNICTNTGGTISFTSNPATLTFTSGFYAHAPICTLGGVPKTSSVVISFSSAPSTTSFSVQESTFNSGDKVSYICIGAG